MSLLLTGVGTLLLTHAQVRRDAQSQLQGEAEALEPFITQQRFQLFVGSAEPTAPQQRRLAATRRSLELADASAVIIDRDGQVVDGTLPSGVTTTDLAEASAATLSASGHHGRLVWAAASSQINHRGLRVVVVLTRRVPFALGSLRWLMLTSGVVLLLAVGVSLYLGRALIAPLRDIDRVTRDIANGDLSTRLAEPAEDASDELADLSRAINAMAASLERSRGLEHQFLMSVSHDLRTPLTSIRGYAEAISDGATDDVEAAATVIQSEAQRLERLVHDLLDLAKLDARAFSFTPELVELGQLVGTAVDGFRPHMDTAGLTIEVATLDDVWVHVDPDRFAQVLANLLENGVKFARSAVRVDVHPHPDGRQVDVSVIDDGPGIDAVDLPHVFDRLYVSKAAPVRKEAGSGLGLAITRELVSAMGGTISAQPGDAHVGARMVVTLPTHPRPQG